MSRMKIIPRTLNFNSIGSSNRSRSKKYFTSSSTSRNYFGKFHKTITKSINKKITQYNPSKIIIIYLE